MFDENSLEVVTGLEAIRLSSQLCEEVRGGLAGREAILKSDRSPVTVADYGSQAMIGRLIRERFPHDTLVAEEDSKELRGPDHAEIVERITSFVRGFVQGVSSREVLSWIDFSSYPTADRFWTLDPIDGTKGFLRGDQYAIALALIEKGRVTLGFMACPNLYVDREQPHGKRGALFFAIRGKGSFQTGMDGGNKRALSVSRVQDPSEASLTESVEPDHTDHLTHEQIARKLNIRKPSLRMDSQAKYAVVARGEATIYLRAPSTSEPGYRENIWDHAAGSIIAEEAGGRVTDTLGQPLDFASGIKMKKNLGVVVTNGVLHEIVLRALKKC